MELPVIKGWTIRRRILASFAIVLGLVVVMGLVALRDLDAIEGLSSHEAETSVPGLYLATAVQSELIVNYGLTAEYVGQTDVLRLSKIEAELKSNAERFEEAVNKYEALPADAASREAFGAFRAAKDVYFATQRDILRRSADLDTKGANQMWREQLSPQFAEARATIQVVVQKNEDAVNVAIQQISSALTRAKLVLLSSFLLAVVLTFFCAYFLLKAITQPLNQLMAIVEVMRHGDFSRRVTLDRVDEFHALAAGCNRMADELTSLVSEVQQSSARVSTSVNEIAATAQQQKATATQIASTTMEIGATSKEISATSRELVKTMNEVATVAEQSAALAGVGQTGLSHMEETMR
jgi:methyl-accepting chemotaxis protein WspA